MGQCFHLPSVQLHTQLVVDETGERFQLSQPALASAHRRKEKQKKESFTSDLIGQLTQPVRPDMGIAKKQNWKKGYRNIPLLLMNLKDHRKSVADFLIIF